MKLSSIVLILSSLSILSSGTNALAASKKSRANRKPSQAEQEAAKPLSDQAQDELTLKPTEMSIGVLPTPATVRSKVDPVASPVRHRPFRVGVGLQPYTARGSMQIADAQPYSLDTLGTRPMVTLEAQWLPYASESAGGIAAGLFVSAGYTQHSVDLRSPVGTEIDGTKLHSLKTAIGATVAKTLPRNEKWSIHGKLGVGRLDEVQSSSSSYANESQALLFAEASIMAEYRVVDNWSAFGGYEYNAPVQSYSDGADIQRNNFILGMMGNFR